MKFTVFFINGKPRAGKDSVVGYLRGLLGFARETTEFSSIDPIRFMLSVRGIDITKKTEADRKLLSVVGDAVEEHSGFRTQMVMEAIQGSVMQYEKKAIFIHLREPKLIQKVCGQLTAKQIDFVTVKVVSPRSQEVTSNPSDAGIDGMAYDAEIRNHGTLEDLEAACRAFLVQHHFIPA